MNFKLSSILILFTSIAIALFFYKFYLPQKLLSPQRECDILIVGSGLAGLTSAYYSNILSKGAMQIIVLEKEPKYGGNSMKATSGINILSSPIQKEKNIKDTFQSFYNDTMKSSKNLSSPELVETLVKDSPLVYDFFTNLSVDISQIGILGGHSFARTHRPTNTTAGYTLTSSVYSVLIKQIPQNANITILLNATVIELLYNQNQNVITGIIYRNNSNGQYETIKAKSVILASGGYAHDFLSENNKESLLNEYAPHICKFPTTNGPQASGLGVKIARKIGADLVDMNQIQIHPTGFVDLKDRYNKFKILAPELIRGVGAILLNHEGKRFCNELGPRDYVSQEIIKNCKKQNVENIEQYEAFIILNQKGVDDYGKNIQFYIRKGFLNKFDNVNEVAKHFNLNEKIIIEVIEEYNQSADKGKDKFGKKVFKTKFNTNQTLYVGIISPSIHYTMGGLKISKDAEVLKKDGTKIKGLFGAGEVTGGVHGGNRLGGNSLLECVVFGRRAGISAYENAMNKIKK